MLAVLVAACILIGLLMVAAVTDIASFTIPNWVSIALVGAFYPLAFALGLSWTDIGLHTGVGLIAFVACFGLFAAGLYGGGDAKLTPAVFLWVGPSGAFAFLMWMLIAGGVLALVLLITRRLVRGRIRHLRPMWLRRQLRVKRGIPYGVAIAFGGIMALSHTVWAQSLPEFPPLTLS